MTLKFLFEEEKDTKYDILQQGDILQRTPQLQEVIRIAHPYYSDAEDYHFFMVLTQSCDLVRRGGGSPRSSYITLAAVRPLEVALKRMLKKYATKIEKFPILVCEKKYESVVRQYLERLLHNTEPGYFFIRRGSHDVFENDYCVFLALTIALRVDHYDACSQAKVAQLKNVFQAKVGWLAGNLYSRVGTPDLEDVEPDPDKYKRGFFDEVLYRQTAWLTPEQRKYIRRVVKDRGTMSHEEAKGVLQDVKSDIEVLAERVADQLAQAKLLQGDGAAEARSTVINVLVSDRVLKRMLLEGS